MSMFVFFNSFVYILLTTHFVRFYQSLRKKRICSTSELWFIFHHFLFYKIAKYKKQSFLQIFCKNISQLVRTTKVFKSSFKTIVKDIIDG